MRITESQLRRIIREEYRYTQQAAHVVKPEPDKRKEAEFRKKGISHGGRGGTRRRVMHDLGRAAPKLQLKFYDLEGDRGRDAKLAQKTLDKWYEMSGNAPEDAKKLIKWLMGEIKKRRATPKTVKVERNWEEEDPDNELSDFDRRMMGPREVDEPMTAEEQAVSVIKYVAKGDNLAADDLMDALYELYPNAPI